MYYSFETVAGVFLLQRQPFTHAAWQLSFNGAFVDSFPSPVLGAEGTRAHAQRLGITDTLQLPPPSLSGWEIHWCTQRAAEAAEVWLHRLYLQGMRPTLQRKAAQATRSAALLVT